MKLYRGNKINDVIDMSHDEILKGFDKSKYSGEAYPIKAGLSFYLAVSDSLNCSFDMDDFDELLEAALLWRKNNEA